MKIVEFYSDGALKEDPQAQGYQGNQQQNYNSYYNEGRNNDPYNSNSYDPFNRNRNDPFNRNYGTNSNGFRSDRLDSSFTTERSTGEYNDTVLYEKYRIFESHRYGGKRNLLFQVKCNFFISMCF